MTIGGLPATDLVFEGGTGIEGHAGLAPGSVNDVSVIDTDGRYGMVLRGFAASFLDVDPGNPFYSDIMKIDLAGITAGCGGGNYCPNGSVSRAQMAVFLLKAEHGFFYVPPPARASLPTSRARAGFAVDWIERLSAEGITRGCGDVDYCPGNVVTRAQMSALLLKTEHGSATCRRRARGSSRTCPAARRSRTGSNSFPTEQITSGCGGNDYCPASPNTRAQMAMFLRKTFGLQ